jgi:ferredoxin
MSEQNPISTEKTEPPEETSNKNRTNKERMMTWDRIPTDESPENVAEAINWDTRSGGRERGLLRYVEYLALLAKEPINKLVGTTQLNPLYYSGTIAFFLFAVVVVTGVYILMFYQYGFDVSYGSIESMERFIVSRTARAIHRYASGGLIIFGTLHAIRMLFMDRFRGPRWLAWFAGVLTIVVLWVAGVTGYWLLWDQGAQLITSGFINLLNIVPALGASFYFGFLADTVAADRGWLLMLLILVAHLAVSIFAGVFYWLHIKRLTRPKFLPPRYWVFGMGALLVIVAVLFPAGLLPIADLSTLPVSTPLDPIFLFYLPPSLSTSAMAVLVVVILLGATGLVAAFPWIFPRPKVKPVTIAPQRCTGCKHCVHDCPYGALSMITREDASPYSLLAQVDENLCVSCGICIGSCDTLAISMCDHEPELLWQNVASRIKMAEQHNLNKEKPVKVIFTCERHVAHGAHTYANTDSDPTVDTDDSIIEVIPVTCVAMVNPSLMTHTLEAGASEVQVVGCPPNDCTNREGNVWMEERLGRTRAPKLKPSYSDAPIFTTWAAPDHFSDAMQLHATSNNRENGQKQTEQHPPETIKQVMSVFSRRNLIAAIILLAVGLLLQVRLTYTPFSAYAADQAAVHIALRFEQPKQLLLEIDGTPSLEADTAQILKEIPVSPGDHQIKLTLTGADGVPTVPVDELVTVAQGSAYRLEIDELFVPEVREEPPEEYDIDTLRNLIHDP